MLISGVSPYAERPNAATKARRMNLMRREIGANLVG
jgi:hypothetical protein